jgi:hypothetical protein
MPQSPSASKPPSDDTFNEEESRRRFESALRGARQVGHKRQSEMKIGKKRKKKQARKKK